jgi:hypothetical protein
VKQLIEFVVEECTLVFPDFREEALDHFGALFLVHHVVVEAGLNSEVPLVLLVLRRVLENFLELLELPNTTNEPEYREYKRFNKCDVELCAPLLVKESCHSNANEEQIDQ